MTGSPSTATQTIVVTYFLRFSVKKDRTQHPFLNKNWQLTQQCITKFTLADTILTCLHPNLIYQLSKDAHY